MEVNMDQNSQNYEEMEIDIRDYINVVVKRKKLIISIFLVAVVTSAIVSLLMPKVYEITSTVQLGSVKELLIKSKEAKEIILNQNSLLSVISQLDLKIEVERLKRSIRIEDVKNTDLLKIKIIYPGIDTVLKINDAIINLLIAQGQIIYQESLAVNNERLKELDMGIKSVEGDISWTKTLISKLPNASNMSQSYVSLKIILLQNVLPNYEKNLTALRSQKNELKSLLANAKNFKIVDAPIRPKNPVGPKKKENVLIAGMLSLMFGIFLAFFLEFWQKNKK